MKFIGCWLLHEQQHLLFNEEELALRETVFLNTDREMPLLGLGVYKTADNEAETAITAAVNAGYRLIDTASAYKNEESVGKAIDLEM